MTDTEVFTHAALAAKAEELKRECCQSLALTIKRDFMLEFQVHLYASYQIFWKKQYNTVAPFDVRDLYRALRVYFPDIVISLIPEPLSSTLTVMIDFRRLKEPEDL